MTSVQQRSSIRFGSAKFEVGETEETMIDLGALNGVEFEESWDEISVMSDNAGKILAGINNHEASIKGDLMEINLTTLAMLRGGIDTLVEVPADEEEGKKAAIELLSGGISEFQPRIVKITNYNERNEAFSITVFKATPASGISIAFPAADSEDPAVTPIEMKGSMDVDRTLGMQLFAIRDEQGVVPTV